MDATQLLAKLRQQAFIGSAQSYTEYDDIKLLGEMSEKLRTDFPIFAVEARAGYLLKATTAATTATNLSRIRVPARAFMNGLHSVECQDANGKYFPLEEALPEDHYLFERQTSAQLPRKFMFSGGHITLLPAPTQPVTLRIRYYLRPSKLTASQNSVNGTDRGRVTAVNGTTVTVNALPFDNLPTTPIVITSGATLDVIQTSGWYEPVVVSQVGTIAGLVITFPTSVDASVQVGDYVRVADQSDWPMLPEDFHDILPSDAALWVLAQMGLDDKSLTQKVGAQYQKFRDSLQPRRQQSGYSLPMRFGGRP